MSSAAVAPAELTPSDVYFFNLRIDPRLKQYAFVGNPWFPLITCGVYLWFVYVAGPKMMAKREPMNLRVVIMLHNAFMVVANAFFFSKFISNSYLANYSPLCQGMTYATDYNSLQLVHWGYWYYLLRIVDFLDTVFFVLRKKHDHVTFHHVSHHFCCVFSGHIWVTLGMDGQTLAGLCINSCIHVFMYTYYFLAACGPRFHKFLWWKKYLTKAQIYQHVLLVLHGMIPIVYDCGYPRFFIYIGVPQGLLGLVLFMKFYVFAYSQKQIAAKAKAVLEDERTILEQRLSEAEPCESLKKCS